MGARDTLSAMNFVEIPNRLSGNLPKTVQMQAIGMPQG